MDGNNVSIVGKLINSFTYSHEYKEVNYYTSTISTEYLRDNIPTESLIRVYLSESDLINNNITPGSIVHAEGEIINSKHRGHKDISVSLSKFESYNGNPDDKVNSVKLTGVITRVFTNDGNFINFVNFIVSSKDKDTSKRSVSVRVTSWNKLATYVYNNAKIGDTVTLLGSISNSYFDPSKEVSAVDLSDRTMISEIYCTACSINGK